MTLASGAKPSLRARDTTLRSRNDRHERRATHGRYCKHRSCSRHHHHWRNAGHRHHHRESSSLCRSGRDYCGSLSWIESNNTRASPVCILPASSGLRSWKNCRGNPQLNALLRHVINLGSNTLLLRSVKFAEGTKNNKIIIQ